MKHLTNDQLQALIDDPAGKDSWISHVENCAKCKEEYESYLHVHQSLLQLEYERPSLRFARNIFELINERRQLEHKERKWIAIIHMAVIASILIIILYACYYLLGSAKEVDLIPALLGNAGWIYVMLSGICIIWILFGLDRLLSGKRMMNYFY